MDNVFELYYKGNLDEEPTLLSCANFGMQVMQFPPIYRAKERVTEIQIPGRSGALTQLEGIDVYEATTRNCVCIVDPQADMDAITELLRGHHIIRFGNEPDRLYDCRIVNQVQLDWMYNDGTRKCTIPFYCQPLKMQYPIEEDIILTQPDTIDNPGTVNAYPKFTITVSESATVDGNGFCDDILFVVRGNDSYGHAITISNMKPGECIVVDWFMGDAYNYADKTNWNNRIIGNPQHLTTGENEISWSGAKLAQVKITPHWRYA